MDLLAKNYKEQSPEGKVAAIFFGRGLENELPNGYNSSNDEVFDYLKRESESAISRAFEIISTRIDKFGVAQPNVQRLDNGRILVELPGVDNPQRVRDLLQSSAKLEFWKVFPNYKGFEFLEQINAIVYGVNKLEESGDGGVEEEIAAQLSATDGADIAAKDGILEGSLDGNLGSDSVGLDSIPQKSREEIEAENPVISKLIPNITEDGKNWAQSAAIGYIASEDVEDFGLF